MTDGTDSRVASRGTDRLAETLRLPTWAAPLGVAVAIVTATALVPDVGFAQSASETLSSYAVPGERTFPEGIALDAATGAFFVGSADQGTIYRGSRSAQEMTPHVSGAEAPPASNGLRLLPSGELLVAGGRTGTLYVYAPDGTLVRRLDAPAAERTFINDSVVVSPTEVYVTDSFRPVLFRADPSVDGLLEPWLDLTATPIEYGEGFNLNGIVATEDGRYLIVAQTNARTFWRIDLASKDVTAIDVPHGEGGADGMRLVGDRLFAVRDGGVTTYRLAPDAGSVTVTARVVDERFSGPTAVAVDGDDLLIVNAQFAARDGTPDLPFTVTRVTGAAVATERGASQ